MQNRLNFSLKPVETTIFHAKLSKTGDFYGMVQL